MEILRKIVIAAMMVVSLAILGSGLYALYLIGNQAIERKQ